MAPGGMAMSGAPTKMVIVGALGELAKDRDFEDITVAEICAASRVSKSTFYRHFRDKYDVVEWYLQDILSESMMRLGTVHDWSSGITLFCRQLAQSRDLLESFSHVRGYESLRKANKRTAARDFAVLTKARLQGPDAVVEFQARYFATVLVDVICDWIEQGMRRPIDELTRLVLTMLPEELEQAIRIAP